MKKCEWSIEISTRHFTHKTNEKEKISSENEWERERDGVRERKKERNIT